MLTPSWLSGHGTRRCYAKSWIPWSRPKTALWTSRWTLSYVARSAKLSGKSLPLRSPWSQQSSFGCRKRALLRSNEAYHQTLSGSSTANTSWGTPKTHCLSSQRSLCRSWIWTRSWTWATASQEVVLYLAHFKSVLSLIREDLGDHRGATCNRIYHLKMELNKVILHTDTDNIATG